MFETISQRLHIAIISISCPNRAISLPVIHYLPPLKVSILASMGYMPKQLEEEGEVVVVGEEKNVGTRHGNEHFCSRNASGVMIRNQRNTVLVCNIV